VLARASRFPSAMRDSCPSEPSLLVGCVHAGCRLSRPGAYSFPGMYAVKQQLPSPCRSVFITSDVPLGCYYGSGPPEYVGLTRVQTFFGHRACPSELRYVVPKTSSYGHGVNTFRSHAHPGMLAPPGGVGVGGCPVAFALCSLVSDAGEPFLAGGAPGMYLDEQSRRCFLAAPSPL